MKIALVHDYLREYGGAERVVEVLHEMYPEAPLYTAFVDWPSFAKAPEGKVELFKSMDIRTSWVQHNWFVKKYHSPLRFLTPLIWESFDLRGFDVVISSSGWYMCRGVVTRPETLHVSYIHHPPRNLYGYPTGSVAQSPFAKAYGVVINPFLRSYDFATAQRVDELVANSETTRERIKKFYRRESTVIYPPVKIETNSPQPSLTKGGIIPPLGKRGLGGVINKSYYLSVGRLTYAKRVDLAIAACNELKLPLKIVGTGREEGKLRAISGPTIEFLGSVSDEQLAKLYKGAKALIFCALEEDFGMVPVEAMSYGVGVIALRQGGVTETIIEGRTGLFFNKPEVEEVVKVVKEFERFRFDPETCIKQAQKFSTQVFKKKMRDFVEEKYHTRQK
ncbi:MAG: glycosyltransferase [Candidatus Gottesmanbacteria bacterium GW2011_GWC1_43_10]|nr:MAG: glycosyltransferase [Candidatus Gottesmanbacteria bacterium GW2011_GWC1_43_10]